MPDEPTVQRLLDVLCVELGFCLRPDAQRELRAEPGTDPDAFTDRVILAEGLDPVLLDGNLRNAVFERVALVLAPHRL